MHNDRMYADVLHQRHILHDLVLELFIDHGIAAVLNDDGLAVKFLYVRQCLDEDCRLVVCRKHHFTPAQVWYSPLIFTYS